MPDAAPATPSSLQPVIAIDPGKDKCGLAVLNPDGGVLQQQIIATLEAPECVASLVERHRADTILIGDSTTSRAMGQKLKGLLPSINLHYVSEKNSTLEARELYWRDHRPRGWRRVLPQSLQVPPVPVDDYAAIVLARRYLEALKNDF